MDCFVEGEVTLNLLKSELFALLVGEIVGFEFQEALA